MKYDIWIPPHMPLKEEIEKEILYMPQSFKEDMRLRYLDRDIYLSLIMKEQLDTKGYEDASAITKDLKSNPDKDEEIFQKYLKDTGKKSEDITDKEFKNLDSVPLTIEDVEESLSKLIQLGYIKAVE